MHLRSLDAAAASLTALLLRADALRCGAGGVPASVSAEIAALSVTMAAAAGAAAAAEVETAALVVELRRLGGEGNALRAELLLLLGSGSGPENPGLRAGPDVGSEKQ